MLALLEGSMKPFVNRQSANDRLLVFPPILKDPELFRVVSRQHALPAIRQNIDYTCSKITRSANSLDLQKWLSDCQAQESCSLKHASSQALSKTVDNNHLSPASPSCGVHHHFASRSDRTQKDDLPQVLIEKSA